MKKIGFILLQISAYLILLGGIIDFITPFYLNTLPSSHLKFLKLKDEVITPELKNLDHALLRAIGGCLVGVGLGSITIIYVSLSKNKKKALYGLLVMITISEGVNASQTFMINAPYFLFPFLCMIMTWLGGALWWFGSNRVSIEASE